MGGAGGRLLYLPSPLLEPVRRRLELSARLEAALQEIAAINLELLARRPDWRERLGRQGRVHVEGRFELARCTERLGRVLERVYA